MTPQALGRALIVLGAVLLLAGLLLLYGRGIPWVGRLPGDLRIDRPGVRVYLPITTSILVSIVISVVLYLLSRFR